MKQGKDLNPYPHKFKANTDLVLNAHELIKKKKFLLWISMTIWDKKSSYHPKLTNLASSQSQQSKEPNLMRIYKSVGVDRLSCHALNT